MSRLIPQNIYNTTISQPYQFVSNSVDSAVSYLPDQAENFLRYSYKLMPNAKEVMTSTLPTIFVEMAGETWLNLGNDIVAKELFRDFAKLFGIGYAYVTDAEYGGTGYKYDAANMYAQVWKFACKSATIGGTFMYSGPVGAKAIAPWANIVCEIPSRALVLTGRQIQDEGYQGNFWSYLAGNSNAEVWLSALTSTFAKKSGATLMGKTVGKLGIHQVAKTKATEFTGGFGKYFGLGFDAETINPIVEKSIDSAYITAKKVYDNSANAFAGVAAATLGLSVEYSFRSVGGVLQTYILTPPARIFQEYASKFTDFEYIKLGLKAAEDEGHLLHSTFKMIGLIDPKDSAEERNSSGDDKPKPKARHLEEKVGEVEKVEVEINSKGEVVAHQLASEETARQLVDQYGLINSGEIYRRDEVAGGAPASSEDSEREVAGKSGDSEMDSAA